MLCLPRSFQYSQKNAVLVPAAALGVGGMVVCWLMSRRKVKRLEVGDGWWGSGERALREKEDERIRPFRIETSDKEIEVPVAGVQGGEGSCEMEPPSLSPPCCLQTHQCSYLILLDEAVSSSFLSQMWVQIHCNVP